MPIARRHPFSKLNVRHGDRGSDLRRAIFLCSSLLIATGLGALLLGLGLSGVISIATVWLYGISIALVLDVAAILVLRRGWMNWTTTLAIAGLAVMLVAIVADAQRNSVTRIYQYVSSFLFIMIIATFWSRRWWHIASILVVEVAALIGVFAIGRSSSTTDVVVALSIVTMSGTLAAFLVERNGRDQRALVAVSDGLVHSNRELENVAYIDSLTGMRNRMAFTKDLCVGERAVAIINVGDMTRLATIFELRQIEEILLTLSRRIVSLAENLSGFLNVYRTGDHEFSIVARLQDGSRLEFEEQIDVVLESLRQPLLVDGQPVYLQSAAGYATVSADEDPEVAVRKAALALYEARRNGSWLQYYSETLERGNARERLVADALISAIARRELHMAYQPIVDRHEKVVSYEALLRWNSDDLGVISPGEFVPIATRAGLISRLSIRALDLVMDDLRHWPGEWPAPQDIHFNVSASDLLNPSVRDTISKSLFEFDVPVNVTFELTESEFAISLEKVEHSIRILKAMGYNIALDDFGTGYSSLSYLSRLPLRTLKIDQSFVTRVPGAHLDETIVETIVQIAERFGFNVVAEGVETREQFDWLRNLGCQFFQGYYFGRPTPLPRDSERVVAG